ncbi:T9SS type A sorting domain-containing protein, partial [bacterium]|nr:T9SS type A sorting domain-containing protein [bacterium]
HVYLNAKDGTFTDKAQPAFQPDLRPLNSTGVGTAVIDWNIDGNYDLIITGWNPPTVNTQAGYLYNGDGAGNFTEVGRVPGGSETVLLFNDWNGDGLYDYLVSGHCWDDMWYAAEEVGRTASVFYNTNTSTTNAPPAAPTNLASSMVDDVVTLSWDAATDDLTPAASLSYEIFLKKNDSIFVISPASFVGGDKDGLRKVVKLGNAYLNQSAMLQGLTHGSYTWGVQAIDASYAGSAFATGSFDIVAVSVKNIKSSNLADIYAYDNMLIIKGREYDQADVEVYNLVGQKIMSERVNNNFNARLPQGIFIIKVSTKNQFQVGKVFIR